MAEFSRFRAELDSGELTPEVMIASQHNPVADTPVIRIRPASDRLANGLKELWQYRELLYFLIWRDVKVRYKQTAIGAAWAIIQPLLTMIIFTLVFGKFANMPSDGLPYPIFTFAALLPWTYFSKALSQSVSSVVADANLITKVYFPRLLLPLAAVVGGLIDFAIAFVFLLGMMAWYGLAPHSGILLLPFFVLLTMLTALSVSVWLSVINVRYRDVGQAIPFLVQIWLFASPVAYPVSVVPENWRFLYNLNPLAGIIEGFRWALLGSQNPPIVSLLSTAAFVLALLYGGIVFFKRMEKTFADVV
jgi:lipopolysaccharide transport system permease protein